MIPGLGRSPGAWDFPGKSTGVGCHFRLQRIFPTQGLNLGLPHCRQMLYHLSHQGSLKVKVKVAQSCLTLCNPMDCSPPGSSVHGIFQTRVLEWGAIAFFEPPHLGTGKFLMESISTCEKQQDIKFAIFYM